MSTAAAPLPPMRRLGAGARRLLDRVTVYLPLLLMGLLALGSYWLLRATPEVQPPLPERAPAHEPDYFMRNFSVRTYDAQGRLKTEVFGTEARHYPDTDTLEVDQARIRSFSPEGRLTTANARLVTTNADQSEYILRGNAKVVREPHQTPEGRALPRLEFQGEHLHIFNNDERVISDQPVLLLRNNDRLEGNTLVYDDKTGVADIKGRVRAMLQPRR